MTLLLKLPLNSKIKLFLRILPQNHLQSTLTTLTHSVSHSNQSSIAQEIRLSLIKQFNLQFNLQESR